MVDRADRVPPKMRTPVTEGTLVVSGLASIWESWNLDIEVFWNSVFKPMWDDKNTTIEPYFIELELVESSETDEEGIPYPPGGKQTAAQIATMRIVCAFAVQAMRLDEQHNAAWSYACEANRWLGLLQGFISGRNAEDGISSSAKKGANARHAENRKLKADVFDWCAANMANYRSMDSAAAAVFTQKIVPVTLRTARAWVGEWCKLQAAGKL